VQITVLTSLYKASKFLPQFMEDILNQTFFDQCQWFLLDAASPENEYSIIQPYLTKYSNIRYERLDKDPGIYACWNYMIRNSDSPYLTNANVDDRMFPTCIGEHAEELDKSLDVDVVYCYNAMVTQPDFTYKDIQNHIINSQVNVFPTTEYSLDALLQGNLPHNHPVWRRSLHNQFGYFNEQDYKSGSDWDFWLRCGVGHVQMKLIPKVLGVYYKNPEGISTKQENMKRNLEEVYAIKNKYMELVK